MQGKESTFVIEVCENCRSHNWNTRHDENKYKNYALESKNLNLISYKFYSGTKDPIAHSLG